MKQSKAAYCLTIHRQTRTIWLAAQLTYESVRRAVRCVGARDGKRGAEDGRPARRAAPEVCAPSSLLGAARRGDEVEGFGAPDAALGGNRRQQPAVCRAAAQKRRAVARRDESGRRGDLWCAAPRTNEVSRPAICDCGEGKVEANLLYNVLYCTLCTITIKMRDENTVQCSEVMYSTVRVKRAGYSKIRISCFLSATTSALRCFCSY